MLIIPLAWNAHSILSDLAKLLRIRNAPKTDPDNPPNDFACLPLDIIADIPLTGHTMSQINGMRSPWARAADVYFKNHSRFFGDQYSEHFPDGLVWEVAKMDRLMKESSFAKVEISEFCIGSGSPMSSECWPIYEKFLKSRNLNRVVFGCMEDFGSHMQAKVLRMVRDNPRVVYLHLAALDEPYPQVEALMVEIVGQRRLRHLILTDVNFSEHFTSVGLQFIEQNQVVEFCNSAEFLQDAKYFDCVLRFWWTRKTYPEHMQKVQFEVCDESKEKIVERIRDFEGEFVGCCVAHEYYRIAINLEKFIEIRFCRNTANIVYYAVEMLLTSGEASVVEEFEDYVGFRSFDA
ncbi:hypothetical protein QR680_009856 [Steinernema hermaphroditum]|uniref:Uncharacterized protein n=1 Tax=Steinernema hermaphroditum TaxID=289476 RepID=A0AA39INT2_9BILA|nr:hypothetical protein QR680_009856 [Steinernema hermaphroditum]